MAEKKRQDIEQKYTWKLEDIYPDNAGWEADFAALEARIPSLEALKETITSSAETLAEGLKSIYSASHQIEKLYVYARMRRDENNASSVYQGLFSRAQGLSVRLSAALSFVDPLLLSLEEGVLRRYMDTCPALNEYRFMLENLLRTKKHVLDEKSERLLSMTGDFAEGAQDIFTMLNNADLRFNSVEHEGKEYPLSHASYIELMQNPDRELRKKVYFQFYREFSEHINTIAATYATSVKKDIFYSRVRGYGSALEQALFSDNVPRSVYTGLIDAVHRNLPTMYRYVELRSSMLHINDIEMYDIYAPLVSEMKQQYTYEQAQEMVLAGLSTLGADYTDMLKEAFFSRWIDVYETPGKTSGAYSWGVYGTHPYVLLNHRGDLDSVFTIAHELGHAMHSYYSDAAQPYATAGYAIFLAEIASTVNEILLTKHLLRTIQDIKLKKYVLNHYIDQFRATVLRQTMFAEFEMLTHDMAAGGEPLTVEALSQAYGKLNKLYYGSTMGADETIHLEWARIPHFYNAFYVYKYATGFSCASAIVRHLEEDPQMKDKYRALLSAGGSNYPLEILDLAGIRVEDAVEVCMQEFAKALEEFQALS